MNEYERGILFVKSHVVIVWSVNEQVIKAYNFRTITIEKQQNSWEIWAFSWESQEEAYNFAVKSLEIRYE
jgi:hypothetical protein